MRITSPHTSYSRYYLRFFKLILDLLEPGPVMTRSNFPQMQTKDVTQLAHEKRCVFFFCVCVCVCELASGLFVFLLIAEF